MKFVKICFSGGGMERCFGCERAPDEIIADCDSCEVNNSNIEESFDKIKKFVSSLDSAFIVGGDHSITYPAFSGSRCDGLIVFDAHPDVQSDFVPPTHEDYLRALVNAGLKDVVIIGVRAISAEEREFLYDRRIVYFDMARVLDLGIEEVCNMVMERFVKCDRVYLSIDIDVVDPAFAPGTGYLEPGGLSSRELLYFLGRLKKMNNLKFVDLVEINPSRDNGLTAAFGRKMVDVFRKS